MKRTYYLFNPGRLSRKDNTLEFTPVNEQGEEGKSKYIPIESVDNLYVFGSLDANSAMYNFLGKAHIAVHFFDYYENYTGSFYPKEYLQAGKLRIEQTKSYLSLKRRLYIAQQFLLGGSFNILKNLHYYHHRGKGLSPYIEQIETLQASMSTCTDIPSLMGVEGNIRQSYYQAFDLIIEDFIMDGRVRNPPKNEVNALISFGNMLCYTLCMNSIYHTQLDPVISFLHEPGYRRYSLALDLAEVFKPMLVDRTIFRVLNKKEIQAKHFDDHLNGCMLNKAGKEIFLRVWEERLNETIRHRNLGRNVSYKHLVKLECYKLVKYILGIEGEYKPFKAWW